MVETMLWLLLASIIPVWVVEAEEWLQSKFAGRGYTGSYQDIRYLAGLVAGFGKESEKWLQVTQEVTLHDAVFFLPGRKLPNDLKGWLWKNGHLLGSKPEVIHAVVGLWGELSPEARKQIADASQLSALHIGLLVRYESQVTGLRGKKLAAALDNLTPSEAYPTLGLFGRMLEKAYGPNCPEAEEWFERWEASLSTPESTAFPVDREWKEGAYTLRFVPRSNPERVFAGVLTNCCQHPDGAGADAAWYAASAPNGGLLALYKERQMVAQSFVWHPLGQPDRVCLDNIEALSMEMGNRLLALVRELRPFPGVSLVTIGDEFNDADTRALLKMESLRFPNLEIEVPDDLDYSDAYSQRLVYTSLPRLMYILREKVGGVYGFQPIKPRKPRVTRSRRTEQKAFQYLSFLKQRLSNHGNLFTVPGAELYVENPMTPSQELHVWYGEIKEGYAKALPVDRAQHIKNLVEGLIDPDDNWETDEELAALTVWMSQVTEWFNSHSLLPDSSGFTPDYTPVMMYGEEEVPF